MKKRRMNPVDEALLDEIEDDAAEGKPARTNFTYAEAIGREVAVVQRSLNRMRDRGTIVVELHEDKCRRRIYSPRLEAWTDWTLRSEMMPRRTAHERPCMCCGETFRSTGIGNRLCRLCIERDGPPSTVMRDKPGNGIARIERLAVELMRP